MSFYLYGFWIVIFLFILIVFHFVKLKKDFDDLKVDNQKLEDINEHMSIVISFKDKDIHRMYGEKQQLELEKDTFGIFKSDTAIQNEKLKSEIMFLKKERNSRTTSNQRCMLFLIFKKIYGGKNFTYKYQLYDALIEDLTELGYSGSIVSKTYIYSLCDEYISLRDGN